MMKQKKVVISAQAEIPLHLQQKKGGSEDPPKVFYAFWVY
jgi:hypothetical protein